MCIEPEFKYLPIYTLFEEIKKAHDDNGSDPSEDYQLLRDIIEDGTIVRGNNRIRAFIYNIPKLKEKFTSKEHDDFIEWVYNLYRQHHEKVYDAIVAAASESKPSTSVTHSSPSKHRSFLLGSIVGGLAVHLFHVLVRPRQ